MSSVYEKYMVTNGVCERGIPDLMSTPILRSWPIGKAHTINIHGVMLLVINQLNLDFESTLLFRKSIKINFSRMTLNEIVISIRLLLSAILIMGFRFFRY